MTLQKASNTHTDMRIPVSIVTNTRLSSFVSGAAIQKSRKQGVIQAASTQMFPRLVGQDTCISARINVTRGTTVVTCHCVGLRGLDLLNST